jgi:DNA polymerase III subunit epsilon
MHDVPNHQRGSLGLNLGRLQARPEDTLLTERARSYLSNGPADAAALIGYVCNLPGAPKIVAEHLAKAMFAGRNEFIQEDSGHWRIAADLVEPASTYCASTFDAITTTTTALSTLSYVVVDVETTGSCAYGGDRITEVAAVVVRDGEIREVFETLVNPQRPIPAFVTRLTRITWDMVKDAPRFADVAPRLLDVLSGNIFAAHNANFDWRFVSSEFQRANATQLIGPRVCTVKLARTILPQLSRRSLDNVARYYGVEITARHRAGGDAIATAKCLVRMLDDAQDRGCSSWEELQVMLRNPPRRRRYRRRNALPTWVDKDTTA